MKRLTLIALLLIVPTAGSAEPPFDAESAAKKLAPFIDQHTFVVGRLDVRAFDISAFLAILQPLLPIDAEEKETMRKTVAAWQSKFTKKGGREIYVVYGASDFPHSPCLLTPIAESPKERNDLAELLKMPLDERETSTAYINGFLCVGSTNAINRLKNRKPTNRADIVEALASTGNAPCQIVLAPSAETRKIFEEIAPTLPAEVGGGPIQTFTKGLKWISLSVGAAPKVELRLLFQAIDAEAAKKISTVFGKGLDSVKDMFRPADAQERIAFLKLYNRAVQMLTPTVDGDKIVIKQELGTVLPELAGLLKTVQPAARGITFNNMKQLGLAAHNYHDTFGHLPTNISDKDGKPLLSWRVAVLPYIEQETLYRQFKLDESWDSDHNKKLIPQMPKIYRSPKQSPELKDRTTYLAPLGKGLMWDNPKGLRIADILDGTSNTILLVESDDDHAVVWTKPDDITIDMKNPANGLIGHFSDGFVALFCDGSVQFVKKDYSALWAMFTRAGGEPLPEK